MRRNGHGSGQMLKEEVGKTSFPKQTKQQQKWIDFVKTKNDCA